MSDALILMHTAFAVVGIVLLIVVARINPVIILVVGSLYLGLATGLGFDTTTTAVAQGFGDLMADVGLIIGFGVLLGSLLSTTGALQRIVELFLRVCGREKSPYVLGLTSGVVFPSIYFDVALVMLAPIARSVAARTGVGIASLGGALAIGLEAGLLMVLPGAAALAGAGALGVPLGTMLLFGLPVAIVCIVVGIFLHSALMRRTWRPAKDESTFNGGVDGMTMAEAEQPRRHLALPVVLLPILVPLALIVTGTVADTAGVSGGPVAFLSNPIVALLIGLLLACGITVYMLSRDALEKSLSKGAATSGTILLFTGVAGSLGEVISRTGIGDIISGLFTASSLSPLLLAWIVAALLRLAQGSGSVAAITAATLLAPVMGGLDTAAVLVLLAAAAGASFGGHVSDNTFWMFRTLLGLSTRGTFQVYTLSQSIMSVVGLVVVLGLSVFA
ncbi:MULTISPECIES: SLC13 family permease [unclassified Actinopolyspora]|uniref:GntP family permease n=1 Tax=Actinopolyspora TaxID=1849 RepID=UPI0013F67790|nr:MULTISPECIES: SLC13 family permease [unclassified Actinopolyspora]NHD19377.1 GntP family permease [Actinopolyspora sp. BKK2]NHE78550.1 GntP family permease [Actinopolyspora sp. BKK1]